LIGLQGSIPTDLRRRLPAKVEKQIYREEELVDHHDDRDDLLALQIVLAE
jgi:hypothetical protein